MFGHGIIEYNRKEENLLELGYVIVDLVQRSA